MKHRYAALLPLSFWLLTSVAQAPFEYADQRTAHVVYSHIVPLGSSGWLTAGSYCGETGVDCWNTVFAYDGSGNPVWDLDVPVYAAYAPSALHALPDGGALVSGRTPMCDVVVSTSTVARISTTGSLLWAREYSLTHIIDRAAISGSGNMAFATQDEVLITNANGDSLDLWPSPLPDPVAMSWQDDSLLVIVNGDSITRSNAQGVVQSSADLGGGVMDLLILDPGVLVLKEDLILRLNDQLAVIDTFDLAAYTTDARAFANDGQSYWVRAGAGMVRFDPVLGAQGFFGFNGPSDLTVLAAAVKEAIVATCGMGGYPNRTSGVVRTYLHDGTSADHDEDVELLIASVDSMWTVAQSVTYLSFHERCTISVVNHGSAPVDQLVLEYYAGPWFCGPAGIAMDTAGMQLQSGDTATFPFPELQSFYAYVPAGDTAEFAFCIMALSPDNIVDRNGADNEACHEFEFINTTGIAEVTSLVISAGPNPFSDRIEFRFQRATDEPLRARLFDANARVLAATLIPKGSSAFTWPLDATSTGIHVLRIEGEHVAITRKLVRQ